MENNTEIENKKLETVKGRLQMLKEHYKEFCRCTSLHGLQYVGEPHRPLVERLFWLFSFLISTGIVAFFIMKVYIKWDTSPVFVAFADTATPVWEIPFPAVTLCPEIKVKQSFFNFTKMLLKENKTIEEIESFEKAKLVCRNFMEFGLNLNSFHENYEVNSTTVEGIFEFLNKASPDIEDTMFMCRWRGQGIDCEDYFKPILTDDGLCFTFNSLSAEEVFSNITEQHNKHTYEQHKSLHWSFEGGYTNSESMDTYPLRSMRSGGKGGLSMMVTFQADDVDPLCSLAIHGIKAVLHNPTDYPSVHDQYFRIPMDRDVVVGIKPHVMTTSKGLRSYSPQRRQCYFTSERHLHFFQFYSQENCQLECFTNYTLNLCKCVTYFMPRTDEMPVCSIREQDCTEDVSDRFSSDDGGLEMCDCLPGCTEIKYDVETSQAQFKINDSFTALDKVMGTYGSNSSFVLKEKMTKVTFYYKDSQFVTSHRSELYGPTDFLASCGGLLGLYLGFSFLSVIEIIYFFTMRLLFNFKTQKK